MLKFLRKYDKWILAVGGTLLMIVFLLPQAMQQMGGDPRDKVIARYAGGSVTLGERQRAQRDVETLAQLHPTIPYLLLGLDSQTQQEAAHWMLLSEEARRAGLIGGSADGAQFMDIAATELGRMYMQQYFGTTAPISSEYLTFAQENFFEQLNAQREGLIRSGLVFETDLLRIESIAMGILRLHRSYFGAPRLSDVESVALAKEQADQVAVNFFILRPTRILPAIPPPSDEEIQAHFAEFRDVVPGSGEFGFGYRMYPGVKIEWLPIERQRVMDALTIDPIEANNFWRKARAANPERYPAQWGEARAAVESDLRSEKADRILADIERFVTGEIRKRERTLPDDAGGGKTLPPDWGLVRPSLDEIAARAVEQVEKAHGVDLPAFTMLSATDRFLIRDDISRLGGVADAAVQQGPERIPFVDLLFNVRELNPGAPYGAQSGLTHGPIADPDGNRYYFVVTEARSEQPGVLDQETMFRVLLDMRRKVAMETLLANADEYIAKVAMQGVSGLAEELDISEVDVGEGVAVARRFVNPAQTVDFDTEAIRNAIIDRAATLNPRVRASEQPAGARTLVLPSPKGQAIVVVEIIDLLPVTVENYRANVDRAEAIGDRDLYFENVTEFPYSWPAVSARLRYESFTDENGDEVDADAGSSEARAGVRPE